MLLFTVCCLLSAVSGCGYTLQGKESLPFDSVRVGRIENRTYEPKLEDKLYKSLADELMKFGIMISDNSGYVINGVITEIELKPSAEKDNVAVQYEVDITGVFTLTTPDGKTRNLRSSNIFISSFSSAGDLQSTMASKEQAIDDALKNLASEIRASVIYQSYGEKKKEKKIKNEMQGM